MIGTWDVRVFAVDPAARPGARRREQRVYRFFATDFCRASQAAKDRARAEGLHAPCVWAATRLPSEYQEDDR